METSLFFQLPLDVQNIICASLDDHSVASFACCNRQLHHDIAGDETRWAMLFERRYHRKLVRGALDGSLTAYQLYCRKALRAHFKVAATCLALDAVSLPTAARPSAVEQPTPRHHQSRSRGGSVDIQTAEQAATSATEVQVRELGAMRFVSLARGDAAIAATDQGHALAWSLRSQAAQPPQPQIPIRPAAAQCDMFAHALDAKIRREAKQKYTTRSRQESRLVFFKIHAKNSVAGTGGAGPRAGGGIELDLWGAASSSLPSSPTVGEPGASSDFNITVGSGNSGSGSPRAASSALRSDALSRAAGSHRTDRAFSSYSVHAGSETDSSVCSSCPPPTRGASGSGGSRTSGSDAGDMTLERGGSGSNSLRDVRGLAQHTAAAAAAAVYADNDSVYYRNHTSCGDLADASSDESGASTDAHAVPASSSAPASAAPSVLFREWNSLDRDIARGTSRRKRKQQQRLLDVASVDGDGGGTGVISDDGASKSGRSSPGSVDHGGRRAKGRGAWTEADRLKWEQRQSNRERRKALKEQGPIPFAAAASLALNQLEQGPVLPDATTTSLSVNQPCDGLHDERPVTPTRSKSFQQQQQQSDSVAASPIPAATVTDARRSSQFPASELPCYDSVRLESDDSVRLDVDLQGVVPIRGVGSSSNRSSGPHRGGGGGGRSRSRSVGGPIETDADDDDDDNARLAAEGSVQDDYADDWMSNQSNAEHDGGSVHSETNDIIEGGSSSMLPRDGDFGQFTTEVEAAAAAAANSPLGGHVARSSKAASVSGAEEDTQCTQPAVNRRQQRVAELQLKKAEREAAKLDRNERKAQRRAREAQARKVAAAAVQAQAHHRTPAPAPPAAASASLSANSLLLLPVSSSSTSAPLMDVPLQAQPALSAAASPTAITSVSRSARRLSAAPTSPPLPPRRSKTPTSPPLQLATATAGAVPPYGVGLPFEFACDAASPPAAPRTQQVSQSAQPSQSMTSAPLLLPVAAAVAARSGGGGGGRASTAAALGADGGGMSGPVTNNFNLSSGGGVSPRASPPALLAPSPPIGSSRRQQHAGGSPPFVTLHRSPGVHPTAATDDGGRTTSPMAELSLTHGSSGSAGSPVMGGSSSSRRLSGGVAQSAALSLSSKPHGSRLRDDIWFGAQWVRYGFSSVSTTPYQSSSGASSSTSTSTTHSSSSSATTTYHAVVVFADGSLGVTAPQSTTTAKRLSTKHQQHDRSSTGGGSFSQPSQPRASPSLEKPPNLSSGATAPVSVISGGGGASGPMQPDNSSPLFLSSSLKSRGASNSSSGGGAAEPAAWPIGRMTWLERPRGEEKEYVAAVAVCPAASSCSSGGSGMGVQSDNFQHVGGRRQQLPIEDVVFAAFGRVVAVWILNPNALSRSAAPPLWSSSSPAADVAAAAASAARGDGIEQSMSAALPPPSRISSTSVAASAVAEGVPASSSSYTSGGARGVSNINLGSSCHPQQQLAATNTADDLDTRVAVHDVIRVHSQLVTCLAVHRGGARATDSSGRADSGASAHAAATTSSTTCSPLLDIAVVSGDAGGEIVLWVPETMSKIALLTLVLKSRGGTSREGVTCVALNDALIIAGGSEGTIAIWRRRFAASPGVSSSSLLTSATAAAAVFPAEIAPELLHREFKVHSIVRCLLLPKRDECALEGALSGGGEGDVRLWTHAASSSGGASSLASASSGSGAMTVKAPAESTAASSSSGAGTLTADPSSSAAVSAAAAATTGNVVTTASLAAPRSIPSSSSGGGGAAVPLASSIPGYSGSAAAPSPSAAALLPSSGVVCKVLKGHSARVTGLHIDNCKIVTCSLDGSIKIWDVSEPSVGRLLQTLRVPSEASSLSVRGQRVLVGTVSGRAYCCE